jgi:metal-responsive CopG/Arc/MetJ family transcriptional regulator
MNTKPLTLTERVQFMLTEQMISRIDAYRRQHRGLPSRSAACRELLEIGLEVAARRAGKGGPGK